MFSFMLQAQIEGDNLFANDQIVNIELNFSQVSFWDSLTLNYETSTYMKADLILTDETGTYSFEDVGVRLKGNSSYGHPGNKKSFKIDFNKYVSGQNYDGIKKLNFSNAYKDPSLVREKIFFDISREVGVPAPRANFASVNFNGTPWGFYTLVEQIDDQFLDWKIEDDDGNLFKAGSNFGGGPGGGGDEADLKYYGTDQASYEDLYVLKSNEDENDWSDLIELVDFIDNSTAASFETQLEDHLDVDNYIKSAALDNIFANLDSYTNSARNYYIYHNLTTDKWEWIKWDANEAFGTYRGGPGLNNLLTLPIDYSADNRPLLSNMLSSPSLFAQYQQEICAIVESYFNSGYMDSKIDGIKALIQEAVYNDNNKQYSNANFDTNLESDLTLGGGPMGGTVYGLKSFVSNRSAYLINAINCESSNSNVLAGYQIEVFPNPSSTMLYVTVSGDLSQNHFELKVYNLSGIEVMEQKQDLIKGSQTIALDLNQLPTGIYVLRMKAENGEIIAKRIVKE